MGFILKSLAVSALAIFVWSLFNEYQINENYYNIPLTEQEAKQKAERFMSSRGWDISNHKYASQFSQGSDDWGVNMNIFAEKLAKKDKNEISKINRLSGAHRWDMRWFKELELEEFYVSYTKDGQLTYFEHMVSDSLAGDSLSQDIAYDIAKIFLKNMPSNEFPCISDYVEDDWKIIEKKETRQPNRIDHYFKLEHATYDFDETKIRMSVEIHGNEVIRYHRWLSQSEKITTEVINFANIEGFFENLSQSVLQIIVFISILIALFYFKIPANWSMAFKIALFLISTHLLNGLLDIKLEMFWYDNADTITSHVVNLMINTIMNGSFIGFLIMVVITGMEMLYRKTFPSFISIGNLFHLKNFTNKTFFNDYLVGIVAGTCILAISSMFYYFMDQSGSFIAYKWFDYDLLLTFNPLLTIITNVISRSWMSIMIFSVAFLIIHQATNSKWWTIFLTALITSIGPVMDTDPLIMGSIYFFIGGLISGYLLYNHGIIAFSSFIISSLLINEVIPLLYTNEPYTIITGTILIMLLLSPLIYGMLHYLKFQKTTNLDHLLNSAQKLPEITTSKPIIPKLELLTNKKWPLLLLLGGLLCLLIPNNNEFKDLFKFDISRSQAIESAKKTLKNDYGADLSDHEVSTNNWDDFNWRSWQNSFPPFHFYMNKRSIPLGYLKQTIGRKGIFELEETHGRFFVPWQVVFFKPNDKNTYRIKINPNGENDPGYFNHHLSDTYSLPSLSSSEAENMMLGLLKKQNINLESLKFIERKTKTETFRTDHDMENERPLTLNNGMTLNERIFTKVSGNEISKHDRWFHIPEDWKREYNAYHPLFLICTWGSLMLWIFSMIIGLYYLIENTLQNKIEISWKYITNFSFLILFIVITNYLNKIPYELGRYSGWQSWTAFRLQQIGWYISDTTMLLVFIITPITALYLVNSQVNNLFSKNTRKQLGQGLFMSGMATFGAFLLYRPINYLIHANFPNYIDINSGFNFNILSYYFPGYGLLMPLIIETLWISMISIFLYQKIMSFKTNGKMLKANMLIGASIFFYLVYGSFIEQPIEMLPHFLSRIAGALFYFGLIKYFWKNNPLSHLFGTFIYFHFQPIINFINLADPTIKIQGWIIVGLFALFFIYSSGIKSIKDSLSSKAA